MVCGGLWWIAVVCLLVIPVTLAISFTPLCQCLSEETLKAVGPFYMVPMPGEVKDPTQGVNVKPVVDSVHVLPGQ